MVKRFIEIGSRQHVLLITSLLALAFSSYTTLTLTHPLSQIVVRLLLLGVMALLVLWLFRVLSQEKGVKNYVIIGVMLVLIWLLISLVFGLLAVMIHEMMRAHYHLGQIRTVIDFVTRVITLLLQPFFIHCLISTVNLGEELRLDKQLIRYLATNFKMSWRQYRHLLITLIVALSLAQIIGSIQINHLAVSYLVRLLLLTIVSTIMLLSWLAICLKERSEEWNEV